MFNLSKILPEVFDDQLQHNSQRISIIKFLFCNTAIFCNLFEPFRAFFRKTNRDCNHFVYVLCNIFQFTKIFFWSKWQWLILKIFGFHQNRRYEIHSVRGQSFTQPEKEEIFWKLDMTFKAFWVGWWVWQLWSWDSCWFNIYVDRILPFFNPLSFSSCPSSYWMPQYWMCLQENLLKWMNFSHSSLLTLKNMTKTFN